MHKYLHIWVRTLQNIYAWQRLMECYEAACGGVVGRGRAAQLGYRHGTDKRGLRNSWTMLADKLLHMLTKLTIAGVREGKIWKQKRHASFPCSILSPTLFLSICKLLQTATNQTKRKLNERPFLLSHAICNGCKMQWRWRCGKCSQMLPNALHLQFDTHTHTPAQCVQTNGSDTFCYLHWVREWKNINKGNNSSSSSSKAETETAQPNAHKQQQQRQHRAWLRQAN